MRTVLAILALILAGAALLVMPYVLLGVYNDEDWYAAYPIMWIAWGAMGLGWICGLAAVLKRREA